jgi:PAS domain S-box-containing protein
VSSEPRTSDLAQLLDELDRARDESLRERREREQLLSQMRDANEALTLASLRWETLHQRLTTVLEASGTGTFSWDVRGDVLSADNNLCALLGVPRHALGRLSDLLGRIHPDDRDQVAARWRLCVESNADLAVDFRVVRADGIRWLATTGRCVVGGAEAASQLVGACVDVTDRIRVAEEQAANRAKDEFLAILGHELRNPLAPILTALHLMRGKDARGESVRREREVIERQVDLLIRLVDDLLDVARINRGKLELERAPIDLSEVVATAVEQTERLVEQRGHVLDVDVEPGCATEGDPARLAQVVANLLTNAIKYTPPLGRIELRGRRDGDHLVLGVRDSGIGIPPHLLHRLFEPFVQGARSVDRSQGGLGIGLTIVKSLVTMHGGEVTAKSDGPGTGSTFEIRLPALPYDGVPDEEIDPVTAPIPGMVPRRVLVVDDNVDVADLVAELLKLHGHHVEVAYDGAAALRLAEAFRPVLALVDIGLPVMDGYELATNLRARLGESCPRLIAISGYGQPGDRARSREAGFDGHLVKPVDVHHLLEIIVDR